jgi:hypothetical protein
MPLRRSLAGLVLPPLLLICGCQRPATPEKSVVEPITPVSIAEPTSNAEDRIVKAVEKLGGKAAHLDDDPAKPIIKVDLAGAKVTDAGLKELADLKGLNELDLSATNVTDAELKALADLTGLGTLSLNYTKVTDAGLKELAGLKGL